MGHPFGFIAEWNALLPLMNFIEDPNTHGCSERVWVVLPGRFELPTSGFVFRRSIQLSYES